MSHALWLQEPYTSCMTASTIACKTFTIVNSAIFIVNLSLCIIGAEQQVSGWIWHKYCWYSSVTTGQCKESYLASRYCSAVCRFHYTGCWSTTKSTFRFQIVLLYHLLLNIGETSTKNFHIASHQTSTEDYWNPESTGTALVLSDLRFNLSEYADRTSTFGMGFNSSLGRSLEGEEQADNEAMAMSHL